MFKKLSDSKLKQLIDFILNDDDYRYDRVKVSTATKGKFELPAPTEADPDNIEFGTKFRAVIVHFDKNFFQSDEDKASGKEPKEKRELYILREGQAEPELMYLSPSSVRRFDQFITSLAKKQVRPRQIVAQFDCEKVSHNGYTYGVVNFSEVEVLDEETQEYVAELRGAIYERAQRYKQTVDQAAVEALIHDDIPQTGTKRRLDAEDEAPAKPPVKEVETEAKPSKRSRLSADDDDV